VLAFVLAVAATGKVLDLPGTRASMALFGVSGRLAKALAIILPAVEIVVAVMLMIPQSAGVGTAGALLLFVLFTVAMTIAVVRGREGNCHCFGSIVSTTFGWHAVARNAVLALLAGASIVMGMSISRSWFPRSPGEIRAGVVLLVAGFALLTACVVGLFWLGVQLWQQNGRLLQRVEQLERAANTAVKPPAPKRRTAPHFILPDVHGTQVALPDLLARGKPLLLIFSDPGCSACRTLEPDIASWRRSIDLPYTVQVISRKTDRGTAAPLPGTLFQERREVMESFGLTATPSAVIIEPDGSIRGEPLLGQVAIRNLFSGAAPASAPPRQTARSSVAPMTKVAAMARIGSVPGEETVAIFWNPSCGFCARMVEQLREVSRSIPASISLVLVSAGSLDATRAHNIDARIVGDPGGRLMSALGGRGTPSAVAIDAAGEIASPVVVGAEAVLELVAERSGVAGAKTHEAMAR
jgi:hypothetical protein